MIFTTNKSLLEWGPSSKTTTSLPPASLACSSEGGSVSLDGPSGRTRHLNLDAALPQNDERPGFQESLDQNSRNHTGRACPRRE
jgi:hypothetical protein